MKRHMRTFILGGLILIAAAASAGAETAEQSKDLDLFFKAKALVFTGDWDGVRSGMESYLKAFPTGKMEDEALYWLARSLDRLARAAKDAFTVMNLKRQAFAALDHLAKEHPQSLWRDDARELQVTIAGGLAVMGDEERRKFLEEAVAAGGKNGAQVKSAALRSILALDSKTVLAVMGKFLKTEGDADLRKQAVTLLGRKYSREVIPLLEEARKSDPEAAVREEAGVWLEKIRTRLIPVQVGYYCFDTTLSDLSQYAKVPEGQVARFTVPHGRTGSEARAKKEIGRLFKSRLEFTGSKATMISSVLEQSGFSTGVSHQIGGFHIQMIGDSLVKSEKEINGLVRIGEAEVPFKVSLADDLVLAARKGSRMAVMFLEMSPAEPIEQTESLENLDISSSGGRRPSKSEKEPVYYSVFNIKGAVIHSTVSRMDMDAMRANLFDYGQAKAEIQRGDGTWILVGEILHQVKENVLIGRRARLIRPDGTTAEEGAEIRVPLGNPERPGAEKKADAAAESVYPLDNGGWIRSSRPAAPLGDSTSGLLDFGDARASLPGPKGTWTLTGRLTLVVSSGQIMAYKAVLTNPEGKTAAQGALIFVPVKNPDQFIISVDRSF